MPHPRIVCISHDAVSMLSELDALSYLVGRPSGICDEKLKSVPSIGGYGCPDLAKITSLSPDYVIGYSDFHASLIAELVSKHISTIALNHSNIEGIYSALRLIGGLVSKYREAEELIDRIQSRVSAVETDKLTNCPSVYFEEWPNPVACAPEWVSQMIESAGGKDIFAQKAKESAFKNRFICIEEVVQQNPDLIFVSWCGKPFIPETLIDRPGWKDLRAVKNKCVFELQGDIVLQPGPRFVEGLEFMHQIIKQETGRM